eukprot:2093259-Prorocentrum_lima.AAC.1
MRCIGRTASISPRLRDSLRAAPMGVSARDLCVLRLRRSGWACDLSDLDPCVPLIRGVTATILREGARPAQAWT